MTVAEVRLWGRRIGAVSLEEGAPAAAFQYDPEFARSNIQVSPITMPLSPEVYRFPALPVEAFRGLPGLLADSLPDRFGNALIDSWLAGQGRSADGFDAVERLCYIGQRGMGALEFHPARGLRSGGSVQLRVDALVELASEVLSRRRQFESTLTPGRLDHSVRDLLLVGTSAGGARAKAVIAWNRTTQEVRSGQVAAPPGFEYWLLKFDGVRGNRDKELEDPLGYCAIEYAYSLMAVAAGIDMTECRLLEEDGRRHFMTKRFDRTDSGDKLHMQSLAALAHFDYNDPNSHSYEQAFDVMRRLGLGTADVERQYRRMVFNVVACNHDDHVKNIAFLMGRGGNWSLTPAFDVTYAYNPAGRWTRRHQMMINGKNDAVTVEDLRACARTAMLSRGRAGGIIDEVQMAVGNWLSFAAEARVTEEQAKQIHSALSPPPAPG